MHSLAVNYALDQCFHKQEVQGLQVFVFSVVTVNDEHRKTGFKIKYRG